jgi:hypothetical protein
MNLCCVAVIALPMVVATSLNGQQSRWDRQVDARLTQAAATLERGYRAAGVAGRGTLNTGESATFSITLPPGVTTVLTGVCDEDCVDLDLSLSSNGYETDAARSGGNAPIVRVTPPQSTTYRVTVQMAECRMNPCSFGIAVFRQIRADSH